MGRFSGFIKLVLGLLILFLVPLTVRLLSKEKAPARTEDRFPVTTQCPDAREIELSYEASVTLHRDLLPPDEKALEAAALEQTKFLHGFLSSSHNQRIMNHRILITAQKKELRITKKETVPYGSALSVDEALPLHQAYTKAAQARGSVGPSDPGLKLTYEARLSAIECYATKDTPAAVKIVLPRDPYLAFWALPKSLHQEVIFHREARVTNPCALSAIAHLKNPELYWYTWNPLARPKGLDCLGELRGRATVVETTLRMRPVEFNPTHPFELEALKHRKRLAVGIMWGLMNDGLGQGLENESFLRLAPEGNLTTGALRSFLTSYQKDPRRKKLDAAFFSLSDLLLRFETIFDGLEISVREESGSLRLRLTGVLKESKRPVDTTVYFGNTSLYVNAAYHTPLLGFLKESDLVFYIGHSGMGDNLNFSKIQNARELSASEKAYQFFGIIGCYSLVDYGFDYLALRPPGSTTDVLLTYSDAYSFLLPYGYLEFVDQFLVGAKPSLSRHLERYSLKQDILWLNRFKK